MYSNDFYYIYLFTKLQYKCNKSNKKNQNIPLNILNREWKNRKVTDQ